MRLRFPFPIAVLAGVVGLGAIAVAGAQAPPTLQPAANPEVAYTVSLTGGATEIPGPGDPDGTGTASVTVNGVTGLVCVNISTTNITGIVNMHIHTGAVGVGGAVLVNFNETSGVNTAVNKCVTDTPANAASIIANPAGFYLNAHTVAFPNGAIRGQLVPALASAGAGALHLLDEPLRAYDSRTVAVDGKLVAGTTRVVDLSTGMNSLAASVAAVPATARAAVVTVTVTQTVGGGFVTAFSNALTTVPATSTVNWTAPNTDVAATTTVAVDGAGMIKLLAGQNSTHVIVDVIGYYL